MSTNGVRVIATLLVIVALSGCGTQEITATPSVASSSTTAPAPTPELRDDALRRRGKVVELADAPDAWRAVLPIGTIMQRLVYRSVSGVDGTSTSVSGAFFRPGGTPPPGGWPLIAYAHGTTGISSDCGPSDQDSMFGDLTAIGDFLAAGYAVVTTDYQGLGLRPGEQAPHPYLEPRTAAYNVVDAVRAVRSSGADVGARWVAAGRSQGGAAVWSTAEQFARYGDGAGELVGVVAVAPLLDARYFVTRAQEGTLTRAQQHLYPLIIHGVAQVKDSVTVGDHLSGFAGDAVPMCSDGRTALAASAVPDDASLNAVTPRAAQTLYDALGQYALPRVASNVPILAIYGADDNVIPVDIMEDTLGRACDLGDRVFRIRHDQQGHAVDPGPSMASWIRERLSGSSSAGNC